MRNPTFKPTYIGIEVTKAFMDTYTLPNGDIDFKTLEQKGIADAFRAILEAKLSPTP